MNQKHNSPEQAYTSLSQTQLIVRRFRRHKLAMIGLYILIAFYTVAIFADFFAPMPVRERTGHQFAPPQRVRFVDLDGNFSFRPFVYGWQSELDRSTFQRVYTPDPEQRWNIQFFSRRHEYRMLGLFPTNIHLFAVTEPGAYITLLGTDDLGRDLFSRIIFASRISLSIGLIGVFLSLIFGLTLGSLSGLLGGLVDDVIQRMIELVMSIPTLPLWMALSAAIPAWWGQTERYIAITVILSFMGWTGVARVVRGKFISLREEEYVLAAYASGVTKPRVVVRHLIPAFMSYVIVHLTLSIPGMILGETALSFLGLGLRRPAVSWGVLLQQAQTISSVVNFPWLLTPGLFVVIAVLCFNFVGDGLRDAADPYSK